MDLIDALDDRELLEVGVFDWAGKWPISRWISLKEAGVHAAFNFYSEAGAGFAEHVSEVLEVGGDRED